MFEILQIAGLSRWSAGKRPLLPAPFRRFASVVLLLTSGELGGLIKSIPKLADGSIRAGMHAEPVSGWCAKPTLLSLRRGIRNATHMLIMTV
jgi:hypothetical protein